MLFLTSLGLCLSAEAADQQDTLKRARMRQGVWLGGGATTGRLKLVSDSTISTIDVNALSVVSLGADIWTEEQQGLYIGLTTGTSADIISQQRRLLIPYNAHQLELGGRYRWFFGPKATDGAFVLGLGVRGLHQTTQPHPNSIVTGSTAVGPELSLTYEQPLGTSFWLRLTGRGGLPFFYREDPTDSGDPQDFLQVGGRLDLVWAAFGDWGFQLTVDFVRQEVSFLGEGTRSVGVRSAEVTDQFVTGHLNLRRAF
ncbi:MAG: hypothetical protein ACE366_17120 [Bradymonadia bacterium]